MRTVFLLLPLLGCVACASVPDLPVATDDWPAPPPPDYAQERYWAALPTQDDAADLTPGDSLRDRQLTAAADVFYVHPTIYTDTRQGNDAWNANLADEKLNAEVDNSALKNQATIFNAAGKVYAPRYRQAHIRVFYREGRAAYRPALDLAYQDVLAAFDHYLEHYNRGRPIIIASHSQGTVHAKRLLDDRFDGKPLVDQLVAAYLVGMPVSRDRYRDIPVCTSATATGCFVSWRTYREDFEPLPGYRDTVDNIAVVNPLSWTVTEERAPASLNRGGVLYNFDAGPQPGLVWAEIRGSGLFTNKPSFFGDIFFRTKNYHIGDYNLFWLNVRENAVDRVNSFLSRR